MHGLRCINTRAWCSSFSNSLFYFAWSLERLHLVFLSSGCEQIKYYAHFPPSLRKSQSVSLEGKFCLSFADILLSMQLNAVKISPVQYSHPPLQGQSSPASCDE